MATLLRPDVAAGEGRGTAPRALRSRPRRPARGGPARGVRAAGRGDLRGLPAALRLAAPAACVPRPISALLAGDQLYAIGLARLVALGDTLAVGGARRHDHAERARAQARATPSWPRRSGRPGARAVGWGPSEDHARQGAACRGRARGARGDAHKRCGVRWIALNPASILFAAVPDKRAKHKSKYTLDRQIPGAFEGETVTRGAFMTGSRQCRRRGRRRRVRAARARLRDRPDLQKHASPLGTVGTVDLFTDFNYVPVVLTLTPEHRRGRQDDGLRAQVQPRHRHRPLRPRQALHRDLQPLRAPRLPGALGGRRRALHLPLPRRRLRPARPPRRRPAGAPAGPLLHARESANTWQLGPRFSVNSELRRFSPRDPGEPLDGIGQYLYPSRPGAQKL